MDDECDTREHQKQKAYMANESVEGGRRWIEDNMLCMKDNEAETEKDLCNINEDGIVGNGTAHWIPPNFQDFEVLRAL